MSWLLATLLGAGAALLQLGAAPSLFDEPLAAPILPLAVIAGWGAARGLAEAVPAAVVAALMLGVASEARAGWFLLAMLPTAALVAPGLSLPPSRRLLLAPAAAALGTIAYQGLLHLSSGSLAALLAESEPLLRGALWSAAPALVLAAIGWALRPRPSSPGLFE